MINYPVPGSTLANTTVAQAQAFLKSPTLLAQRLAEILSDHNFLAHYLLRGQYRMVGGAVAYVPDESTSSGAKAETVAPGGEYPLTSLPVDTAVLVAALKKGLATEIADETVGRLQMDPVERGLQMLAYDLVSQFDEAAISAIRSAVAQVIAASGSWATGELADRSIQIVTDVEVAKATIKGQKKGYRATSVVLTDLQWAAVAPALLPLLPRESGNPILSGGFPNILGVDWVSSSDLPAGWVPLVTDADNLGGIGHEDIPSEGYVSLSSVAAENRSNVEVKRSRQENDSTRVQVRKADVPVVRNPNAGVKINGTGI